MAKKAKAKKAKVNKKAIVKAKTKKTLKVKKKVAKAGSKKATPQKTNSKKKTAKPAAKKMAATKTNNQKKTAKPVVKKVAVKNWQTYLSPLYDRVLLEKVKQEIVTKSGIYLGEEASNTTYAKAKVLAVGKGLVTKKGSLQPLDVKEGDTVFLSAYAGSNIKVENQELTIVREDEILGIME